MDKTPVLPIETQNLSAVLFSVSQQAFHIEPLKEYVKLNVTNCANNHTNDYQLIGIFKDELDGHRYIDGFREALNKIKAQDDRK